MNPDALVFPVRTDFPGFPGSYESVGPVVQSESMMLRDEPCQLRHCCSTPRKHERLQVQSSNPLIGSINNNPVNINNRYEYHINITEQYIYN